MSRRGYGRVVLSSVDHHHVVASLAASAEALRASRANAGSDGERTFCDNGLAAIALVNKRLRKVTEGIVTFSEQELGLVMGSVSSQARARLFLEWQEARSAGSGKAGALSKALDEVDGLLERLNGPRLLDRSMDPEPDEEDADEE